MRNNKGFSLIELIAVVGIISILTGMLTPMFVRYVNVNKEKACRQNREAIMNIYEKGVYAGNFTVDEAILDNLIAHDGSVSAEYDNQASLYLACPGAKANGQYSAKLTHSGTVMEIVCAYHDTDDVAVDFIGWTGSGNEDKNDPGFTVPGTTTAPVPTEEPGVTTTPTPTVELIDTGVWPYVGNDDGSVDARWTQAKNGAGQVVGLVPGAHVDIPIPERAHFIASKTGNEYVIVKSNGGNSGYYQVNYEWSDGPETIDKSGWDCIVLASGVKYDNIDNPPPYLYNGTSQCIVAYGDMLTMHYPDGDVTYIYGSYNDTSGVVNMPTSANTTYGTSYNNWYVVPPLYKGSTSN